MQCSGDTVIGKVGKVIHHFNKLAAVALGPNLKPFESVNTTCPGCDPSDKVITAVSAVTLPGLPL